MASIGSLLSSNSTLLRRRLDRRCRSRPLVAGYRPPRPLETNGADCRLRLGRDCGRRVLVGPGLIRAEKGRSPRATRGGAEGEEANAEDDEGVNDEALRATIKQSKKVLAVHRELLQQIVERKKKNSSTNMEHDEVSYKIDDSFATGDRISTSEGLVQEYNNGVISDKYAQSTESELSESLSFGSSGITLGEMKQPEKNSRMNYSLADALGLTREASTRADQSKILSPFLSEATRSDDVDDENVESFRVSNLEDMNEKLDADPGERNMTSPPLAGANVMNIVLVTSECAPWSKTGGLGDVAGALPKALARRGHRVMVVAPMYGNYAEPQELGVRKRYKVDGQDMEVSYFHSYIDGVDFVFMESPVFRHRENDIYGGNRLDILQRMVLFCKAAVEVPWHVPCGGVCYGDGNLVFIANDWHTALLPVYLKAYYRDNGLMNYARCVLVIHNIAHQGRGPLDDFNHVDLPGHFVDLFKLHDPMGGVHFNIFAAGLKTADRVVTVSHGYAWELKTQEGGWGLHGIINESDWKFHGIVNGIDAEDWNPKYDVHLKSDGYANYFLETLRKGKSQCKAALQRELGLPVRDDVPILAFIGRLDHQKGVDLIAEAAHWIVGQDVQLIMLGSGRADLEQLLRNLENQYHDKVRGWVGFSVKMAHRITAGSDVLLMPSRFEPCGLNQLYAMMYGTIPVVHAVGGLRDTVHNYDPYSDTGFGWTFDRAEANKLIDALGHCLNTYWNFKNSWEGLQRRGMLQDLSWDNAAERYEEVLVAAKYQW